jgi:hypothetical protein
MDSIRAIEQLAEELFDPSAQALAKGELRNRSSENLLSSRGFVEIVSAFRSRTLEERAGAGPATRVAAAVPLEILRAEDVDVFENEQIDEATWMMREAAHHRAGGRRPRGARPSQGIWRRAPRLARTLEALVVRRLRGSVR